MIIFLFLVVTMFQSQTTEPENNVNQDVLSTVE